jgi:hypothetical protein
VTSARQLQSCGYLLLAHPACASASAFAEPLDEHMILVMPTAIATFDASTVKITGSTRTVRTNLYLPAPDKDGHVSYHSLEDIDCPGHRHRYTGATRLRPDGKVDEVTAEQVGFVPNYTAINNFDIVASTQTMLPLANPGALKGILTA